MNIHLVEDWHRAWTWFSVWAMAGALAALGAWAALPDDLKAHLPSWLGQAVAMVSLVLGFFGRIVRQGGTPPAQEGDKP